MTIRALSRQEVRDVDRRAVEQYQMSSIVLMENAGRGAAELLIELGALGNIVICTGKGNNGGDGFVIARHLENHGCSVAILMYCPPAQLSCDAAANYRIVQAAGTPLRVVDVANAERPVEPELVGAHCVVDALLGTGTTGTVREPYVTAIGHINSSGARVFAVDLPSGLDCDTGLPLGECVRAEQTATFVARKIGFDKPASHEWTGDVHVIDIGVPRVLLQEFTA